MSPSMLVLLKICWAGGGERERANRCSIFRARILASHISPVPSTTPSLVIQVFKIGGHHTPLGRVQKTALPFFSFFNFPFLKKSIYLLIIVCEFSKKFSQPFLLRKIKILYTSSLRLNGSIQHLSVGLPAH